MNDPQLIEALRRSLLGFRVLWVQAGSELHRYQVNIFFLFVGVCAVVVLAMCALYIVTLIHRVVSNGRRYIRAAQRFWDHIWWYG